MDTKGDNLTWIQFARKVIEYLGEYDRDNGTHYSYYFDGKDGDEVLASTIDKANKSLMWQEVQNDGKSYP